MRITRKLIQSITIFAISLALGGCLGIPLHPERPLITAGGDKQDTDAQLFLVIKHRVYENYAIPEKNFAVYVDGVAQAWIPESGSYTHINIAPGQHTIRVEQRSRGIGVVLLIPFPLPDEVKAAELAVDCFPMKECGAVTELNFDRTIGVIITLSPLSAKEIPRAIEGLRFVEAK